MQDTHIDHSFTVVQESGDVLSQAAFLPRVFCRGPRQVKIIWRPADRAWDPKDPWHAGMGGRDAAGEATVAFVGGRGAYRAHNVPTPSLALTETSCCCQLVVAASKGGRGMGYFSSRLLSYAFPIDDCSTCIVSYGRTLLIYLILSPPEVLTSSVRLALHAGADVNIVFKWTFWLSRFLTLCYTKLLYASHKEKAWCSITNIVRPSFSSQIMQLL